MFKALFFIRRKPGLSHESFRAHFENVHVKLAQRHFGHLMLGYQRNYPTQVIEGGQQQTPPFDCISEWFLPDRAAFDAIRAILDDPVKGQVFRDDEVHFLDRGATRVVLCDTGDVIDTGTVLKGE